MGSFTTIGTNNVSFIKEYMKTEGYSIAAESLGGLHPIILNYFPYTGIAKVKRLEENITEIANTEKSFRHELEEQSVGGEIELFDD
jgi:chemotaxis protein CheD